MRSLNPVSLATIVLLSGTQARGESNTTWPVISEQVCPAHVVSPEARDGHKAAAVIRIPPGKRPFPALVILHGGLNERNVDRVRREVANQPTNSRFLAAGYVTVEGVFRSRSDDPQATDALVDCLAIIQHVKKMPEVDPKSVLILGHSGGGSLALELAGETELCAVVAGEPASIIFTGMYNKNTRRRDQRDKMMENPKSFYTPELQKLTRAKVARITCPVLIVHGDQHPINKINHEIVIPELKHADKRLEVILYPGQPHTFVFGQEGSPEAAKKCFDDCNVFFKEYLPTQPVPLESSVLKQVSATETMSKAKRNRTK
jgi:dipeptidyl aminopeptidase/acylaminoacyl peptidase